MTGFLGNLISEFTHQGGSEQQQQQQGGSYGGSYGGGSQYQSQGPPQVYPPWRAVWEEGRWLFINEQTGQRTFEHPGYNQGGYTNYNSGPPQAPYGQQPQQQKSGGNHNLMYGAVGAAAGLAGGAFLMHEGEEIKDKFEGDEYRAEDRVDRWDEDARRDEYRAEDDIRRDEYRAEDDIRRDEYRAEDRMDRWGDDIRDAPENVAEWTGSEVQKVEDIPEDIEHGWDRMEDRVEDFPERIANDIGQDVGAVESFGDNIDDAYDQGRDEQRYEDDRW